MATYHTGDQPCPLCNSLLQEETFATGDDGPEAPAAGDYAICWYCTGLLRFQQGPEGLTRRAATQDDWNELPPDQQAMLRKLQEDISVVNRNRAAT